jgi:hypothetical protein
MRKIFEFNSFNNILLVTSCTFGLLFLSLIFFNNFFKTINLIGLFLLIFVILYIVLISVVNKLNYKECIKKIVKTLLISLATLVLLSITFIFIFQVFERFNNIYSLIFTTLYVVLMINLILIFVFKKVDLNNKKELIKKILKYSLITVIILIFIYLFLSYNFKNQFKPILPSDIINVYFENIPNPTSTNPFTIENSNIYIKSGKITVFGMKIFNTMNETVNISINNSKHSECKNFIQLIPSEITNIAPKRFIETAGIINSKENDKLKEIGSIFSCPIIVELKNSTDVLTSFSKSINIFVE